MQYPVGDNCTKLNIVFFFLFFFFFLLKWTFQLTISPAKDIRSQNPFIIKIKSTETRSNVCYLITQKQCSYDLLVNSSLIKHTSVHTVKSFCQKAVPQLVSILVPFKSKSAVQWNNSYHTNNGMKCEFKILCYWTIALETQDIINDFRIHFTFRNDAQMW